MNILLTFFVVLFFQLSSLFIPAKLAADFSYSDSNNQLNVFHKDSGLKFSLLDFEFAMKYMAKYSEGILLQHIDNSNRLLALDIFNFNSETAEMVQEKYKIDNANWDQEDPNYSLITSFIAWDLSDYSEKPSFKVLEHNYFTSGKDGSIPMYQVIHENSEDGIRYQLYFIKNNFFYVFTIEGEYISHLRFSERKKEMQYLDSLIEELTLNIEIH